MVQLPKRIDSEFFKGDPFEFLTAEITFEFTISHDCIRCHEEGRGLCRPDSNGKFHCASPTTPTRIVPDEILNIEFSKLLENGSCAVFNYNITVPPSSPMGYFDLQNNISTFNCSRHQHKLNHTNDFINYTNDFINYTSTRCPSSVFYFAPPSYDDQSLRSLISLCSMVKLPVRQDSQFIKNPFGFLNAEITFEFTFSDDCIRCSEDGRSLCRPDSNGKFHCASPTR
ncbi:hypothetical protein JHK82_056180 [Glycine max]|nr:hypothetical protein JHK82_056180 [Glycine max]